MCRQYTYILSQEMATVELCDWLCQHTKYKKSRVNQWSHLWWSYLVMVKFGIFQVSIKNTYSIFSLYYSNEWMRQFFRYPSEFAKILHLGKVQTYVYFGSSFSFMIISGQWKKYRIFNFWKQKIVLKINCVGVHNNYEYYWKCSDIKKRNLIIEFWH